MAEQDSASDTITRLDDVSQRLDGASASIYDIQKSFQQHTHNSVDSRVLGGPFRSKSFKRGTINPVTGLSEGGFGWEIDEFGNAEFNNGVFRGTITGSGITGGFLRTAVSGARVEITGNDINLYDDSTGGGNQIVGDTASINFIRTDDSTKHFTLQKRAGKDNDSDNVLEMFPSGPATSRYNIIFWGRAGDTSSISDINNNQLTFSVKGRNNGSSADALNGTINFEIYDDNISRPNGEELVIPIAAYSNYSRASSSNLRPGVSAIMGGWGDYGVAALAYYSNDVSFDGWVGLYLSKAIISGIGNTSPIGLSLPTIVLGSDMVFDSLDLFNIGGLSDSLGNPYSSYHQLAQVNTKVIQGAVDSTSGAAGLNTINLFGSGFISTNRTFTPTATATIDLGLTSRRWNQIWTRNVNASQTINTTLYQVTGNSGDSGTFTTTDLKTVTVQGGIITNIS